MGLGRWIGGFLGFMSAGPLGALAGIVLGGVFDKMIDAVNTPGTQGTFDGQSGFAVLHVGAGLLHHQGRWQGDALRDGTGS